MKKDIIKIIFNCLRNIDYISTDFQRKNISEVIYDNLKYDNLKEEGIENCCFIMKKCKKCPNLKKRK